MHVTFCCTLQHRETCSRACHTVLLYCHKVPFQRFALGFQPGRVATLIDDPHSETHGVAFQLLGDSALEYLNNREVTLGGYVNHMTTFYPADATDNRSPFPVLLFMATPSNEQWLGSAPLEDIAEQVRL